MNSELQAVAAASQGVVAPVVMMSLINKSYQAGGEMIDWSETMAADSKEAWMKN